MLPAAAPSTKGTMFRTLCGRLTTTPAMRGATRAMPSADAMGVTPIEKAEASRRAALAGSNRAGFDDIAKDLLNDLNAGKADAGSLRREAAQEVPPAPPRAAP